MITCIRQKSVGLKLTVNSFRLKYFIIHFGFNNDFQFVLGFLYITVTSAKQITRPFVAILKSHLYLQRVVLDRKLYHVEESLFEFPYYIFISTHCIPTDNFLAVS